jgi:hypothetical protein
LTYYDILGVQQTASAEEIKRAYRRLAQEFHPDKLTEIPPAVAKLAEEKFKDVQEAYEILTKHRVEYDQQLRAVGSAAPPTSPPKAQTARPSPPRSNPKSAPQPSPPKKNQSMGYFCGKLVRKIPWQAWVVFGGALLYFAALAVTSNNSPGTFQAPTGVTSPATQATEVSQVPSTPTRQQIATENKAVTQDQGRPSVKITEQFGGIVHNQSSDISAEFGIIIQDAGGALSGCMGVKEPLFGSGPLSGRATAGDVSFVATSAIGKITFVGQRRADAISGTYKVEHESGPTELGTFTLSKVKSEGLASDFERQRCPTDAEVHQQKTANSVTPTPVLTPQRATQALPENVAPQRLQAPFLAPISPEEAAPKPATGSNLSILSVPERQSIESACLIPKMNQGPAAYNRCLNDQLSQLGTAPRRPDLSGLSEPERQSIESACLIPKMNQGPAVYNRCLVHQLDLLRDSHP